LEIEENFKAGRVGFSFPFCVAASWDILICVCGKTLFVAAKSCGVKPLVVVLLPRLRYKWQRPAKKRDGGGTKSGAVIK
jgi:hypothetical protein